VPEGIQKITETGIISSNGTRDDFDVIVLATGFKVQQFLTPMEIIGSNGVSLQRQWDESRGAQAYLGTVGETFSKIPCET
jgi:cation diffusion facilitator CzcD-associated flavoprotein CzcO